MKNLVFRVVLAYLSKESGESPARFLNRVLGDKLQFTKDNKVQDLSLQEQKIREKYKGDPDRMNQILEKLKSSKSSPTFQITSDPKLYNTLNNAINGLKIDLKQSQVLNGGDLPFSEDELVGLISDGSVDVYLQSCFTRLLN